MHISSNNLFHKWHLLPSTYADRFIVWIFVALLAVGCKQEEPEITHVDFEQVTFGDFVEPDFPYITTSIDARELGDGFPTDNISARVLAIKLGDDAYASFDPDMLRWTVAWTGEFLPMVTMAQISYNSFYDKNNKIPRILGVPHFATGQYPGWMAGVSPEFVDPRPANPYPGAPSWGPLDAKEARWEGHYLANDELVLSYTVKGTPILEKPGALQDANRTVFTRSFQLEPHPEELHVVLAEVTNGSSSEVTQHTAKIYHDAEGGRVTGIHLTGKTNGLTLHVKDDRFLYVSIPRSNETLDFGVGIWSGANSEAGEFANLMDGFDHSIPAVKKGSPPRWKEKVLTKGELAPDTALFVTDRLTLPVPNPWSRNVRVVDLDFFDKSKAAVVTFDGDVWILEGINDKLNRLSWKRFASGFYEPQAISVVDKAIYVYGKEGIVRLHDLNKDGEADYYENFSNIMAQSIETREWASDMVKDPTGGFYIAKFGALDMGPETSSPKAIMGFRAGSQHGGAVFKVSADGRDMEMIASGFRGPYLGIDPKTGTLTGSDQQGHHMPSTPIMMINKGDYYGVSATAHLPELPEVTPPLTWIPHAEDRSGVSQVWVHSDQMGPLNGKMVHLSYGRPGLFQVLVDDTGNALQGAVTVIDADYPAPTMKAEINPGDGFMYLAGFALWGHKSDVLTAMLRLRYTGRESHLPEKFQARNGGVMIRFATELDESSATDVSNYTVKRWNYKRTGKYGSGHYKLNGEDGEEQLPVLAVELSKDRKAVFLVVPNMAEVMQMEVGYRIGAKGGLSLDDKLWFTVNDLAEPNLLAEGFKSLDLQHILENADFSLAAVTEEETVSLEHGRQLYAKMNCIACHSIDGNNDGRIGPGMKGIFGKERPVKDGEPVLADDAYLTESIIEPSKKIVAGYDEGMPSFLGVLSENDVSSLIMYIKSL
ncbi:c-type cytochrome [Lunatimonas salinarum]|uniref:c-type cytochrome n=1 Tax=Lunatimonas salinarum TaxID=1774590 RepID=UPI001ADF45A8|nr:cytochrome c [Lunatimonas salinarum]